MLDTDCTELSGHHKGRIFYNCTFRNLRGLTLENCVLNQSKFLTDKLEDALGFTVTMDCHSFDNVECSELLFDLMLLLLCKTKGNTEKRKKLLDVIGRDRAFQILSQMKTLERIGTC